MKNVVLLLTFTIVWSFDSHAWSDGFGRGLSVAATQARRTSANISNGKTMRDQLQRLKLPLAMLAALLLFLDAGIIQQLFLHGLSISWFMPEPLGRGWGQNRHEPTLFVLLDGIFFTFILLVNVGAGWLIWQVWRGSGESRLLRWLLGGGPINWTERDFREFEFTSTISGVVILKGSGLALICLTGGYVESWMHPSWSKLPYLILLCPIALFLWAAGIIFLLGACQIQIRHGQLLFRRIFSWRSVPIESITTVKARWFGVDVTADFEGKRHRFFFNPEDLWIGPSPPPVIQFLEEACRRNAGTSQTST